MSAEFSKLYQAIVSNNQIVCTELINSNTDVLKETVKHSEDTLLHVAAYWKRRDIAEIIIDLRPSLLLEVNAKGETPLHVAASAGSKDVTQLIMGCRHQIESAEPGETIMRKKTEIEKETALHKAARNGHLGVVKLLIREDPELTKLVNKEGDSPLFMAVDTLQIKVARNILRVPDYSFQGSKNMNALHAAIARRYCSFKGMKKMNPCKGPLTVIRKFYLLVWRNSYSFKDPIAVLNEAGRGIVTSLIQISEAELVEQQEEYFGWTPLHLAAHMNDTLAIQLFVSVRHSAASIKDSNGTTALHIAAKQGHVRAVEKLVKFCPEICGIMDNNGQTFFHIAVKNGRIRVVRFILEKSYPLLFDLLNYVFLFGIFEKIGFSRSRLHGKIFADDFLNMQDNQGNTAFHLAALEKHLFISFLLAKDRRFSRAITNNDGLTDSDILIQSPPASSLKDVVARLTTGGRPGIKHILGKKEMDEESEEKVDSTKKKEKKVDKSWDLRQINLLISTIIATVSFAAALSVPGGLKNNGPDEGTAVLAQKNDFRNFVIFNAIAFGLSVTTMIMSRYIPSLKSFFDGVTLIICQLATVALVVAFIYGNSAVLGPSEAKLATDVKYVICVCLSLIVFSGLLAEVYVIIIHL